MKKRINENTIIVEVNYTSMKIRTPESVKTRFRNIRSTVRDHYCDDDFVITEEKVDTLLLRKVGDVQRKYRGLASATFCFNNNGLHVFINEDGLREVKKEDDVTPTYYCGNGVTDIHFSRLDMAKYLKTYYI